MKRKSYSKFELLVLIIVLVFIVYNEHKDKINTIIDENKTINETIYKVSNIPDYDGKDYIIINNNEPEFDDNDKNINSFEQYSDLDSLGRCGVAYANLSYELMPSGERGNISYIKPSGWKISRYDFIEGEYLFNRCHLIAYSLAGENDNEKNLITCTRYLNATTMQNFEIKIANYIRKTKNHVLYRVTPVFDGNNPIVKGVQMEALSIEDNGKGIKFNIFAYNIEPNIYIDYKTGDNHLIISD